MNGLVKAIVRVLGPVALGPLDLSENAVAAAAVDDGVVAFGVDHLPDLAVGLGPGRRYVAFRVGHLPTAPKRSSVVCCLCNE